MDITYRMATQDDIAAIEARELNWERNLKTAYETGRTFYYNREKA